MADSGKAKKPRSEAQINAFEKARAAREANLRKKFEAEQQAAKAEAPAAPPKEEAKQDPQEPPSSPASSPVYSNSATPEAAVSPQKKQESDDSGDETFDVDAFRAQCVESVYSQFADQFEELKESLTGVRKRQDELSNDFTKHQVRTHNALNFV
jgi:hypothetical protein